MLEELQKFDRLGSKEEIGVLLFKILSPNEFKNIRDVRTLFINQSYTFAGAFSGIITLLETLGLIEVAGDLIKRKDLVFNLGQDNFFESTLLFEKIFNLLKNEGKLFLLFNENSTKLDNKNLLYYIKESQISFSLLVIKKVLVSTGFLLKHKGYPNALIINPIFTDFFASFIISNISNKRDKEKISLAQLQDILKVQNKLGEEAESFVFSFENKRLILHPFRNKIKIISYDFANAGYDLASYNSESSVSLDRFIEVKSYSKEIRFYWSKNEVDAAQELGESYYLYLVNRDNINEKNYIPHIIKNPFKNIFQSENWTISTDSYLVTSSKI